MTVEESRHHPDPPHDLPSWRLPMVETHPPWIRCHSGRRNALDPNRRPVGRFSAPSGEYGVVYVATDPFGAFIETLGTPMQRNHQGFRFVSSTELSMKTMSRIETRSNGAPLRLVDLTGNGLSQIGADSRLTTGTDRPDVPKRWALALYRHSEQPDGLLYRVRHDPSRTAVAFFDRAVPRLRANAEDNLLVQDHLLAAILDHYRFGVM